MASLGNLGSYADSFSGDPELLKKLAEMQNSYLNGWQTAQAQQAVQYVEEQYTEFEEIELTDFRKKAIDDKLGHLKKI